MKSLTNYIIEKFSINEDKILRPKSRDELVSIIKELVQDTKNRVLDLNHIDVSALPEDFTENLFFYARGKYVPSYKNLIDENIETIDISKWEIDSIGDSMFGNCDRLINIYLPESVKEIDDDAFLGCNKLKDVTIPKSVITIGNYAFEYCNMLKSIVIPNSVTSIGSDAFNSCSHLTITVPNEQIEKLVKRSGFKGKIEIK